MAADVFGKVGDCAFEVIHFSLRLFVLCFSFSTNLNMSVSD